MLLLVDYSSMLYRAFHSTPSSVPMNGLHGFLGSLARVIADRKPSGVAICCDYDWRPQFRVDALPMYKTHRVAAAVEDPVTPQEVLGREFLDALGLAVVGWEGYEAEDIVATLAHTHRGEVIEILSGDRDLFDLVEDPRIRVLYPAKGGIQVVTESWITEKYGIPGRSYGDFALLRGDPSDGLPGVAGIGEKTASTLIARYGDLQTLQAATDLNPKLKAKLEASADYLKAAAEVVMPVRDLPLPQRDLSLPEAPKDRATLERITREYSLDGAVQRFQKSVQDLNEFKARS
ncbi:MAG: 5'-3' exonuclease [Candidatus Eremiobacteraeota bacterium]|nr:5'-3' exonuclease [Candidatus Eremiobacteraeota bacterium]